MIPPPDPWRWWEALTIATIIGVSVLAWAALTILSGIGILYLLGRLP